MMERWYKLPQLDFSSSLIYSKHGDEEGDNLENVNDAKKRRKEKVIAKALGHYPIAPL